MSLTPSELVRTLVAKTIQSERLISRASQTRLEEALRPWLTCEFIGTTGCVRFVLLTFIFAEDIVYSAPTVCLYLDWDGRTNLNGRITYETPTLPLLQLQEHRLREARVNVNERGVIVDADTGAVLQTRSIRVKRRGPDASTAFAVNTEQSTTSSAYTAAAGAAPLSPAPIEFSINASVAEAANVKPFKVQLWYAICSWIF